MSSPCTNHRIISRGDVGNLLSEIRGLTKENMLALKPETLGDGTPFRDIGLKDAVASLDGKDIMVEVERFVVCARVCVCGSCVCVCVRARAICNVRSCSLLLRKNNAARLASFSNKMKTDCYRSITWTLLIGFAIIHTPLFLARATEVAIVRAWAPALLVFHAGLVLLADKGERCLL